MSISAAFQQQQLFPISIDIGNFPNVLELATNMKAPESRSIFDFATEEMAKYFHMPQREAARQLGAAIVAIMKSKKHALNCKTISREGTQHLRQERRPLTLQTQP
ncbi:hypothetical protein PHYPSEUDO_012846 [Phytophthora pseudosyringae]|uniref:Uncharacterized protein n=1 Tax=Phytophthora pseudosyringae TaxID=221518 RepID=A0A8T1V8Y5_9STRA|nr:hypothetical protein PHYPSEUDO_012846 [Phytophthora pseudosyringae]